MAKTFHGKVNETVDALIILEACRQGALPRITRRLLAAERGETRPPPEESTANANNPPSSSSAHQSSRRSAASASSATASSSSSLIATSTSATSSSPSSLSTWGNTQAPASSPTFSSSSASLATSNPSLIIPGSVFVFDEEESGIHRWTDGKIWSPSRICGNFLVYRELYRKLPNQKCFTTSEKALMKDGTGLKDQKLKEKVDKENLVVMGCMKGTFVLKNGGLIKKTICVKGINLVPPEELKKRLERPSSSSSEKGGRGSGRGKGANLNMLPGFSTRGTQHLVCYERPGETDDLHGPRDYIELRNLPISKTFVMMQTYRVPIKILPQEFGQQPLDPADEYIHSSRVAEARSAKLPVADASRAITPTKRGAAKRRPTQGQRRKGAGGETLESENESFDYLVDDSSNSDNDNDADMSTSRPIHSHPPGPVAPVTHVIRHNYPTRGQDRQVREQIRQLLQPWSPSPPPFEPRSSAGKKRKVVSSQRVDEESSLVKIEKRTPTLNVSHPVGYSSGRSFQHDDQTERGQIAVVLRPSATTRSNPAQMQDVLDSMSNRSSQFDQGDDNLMIYGYKSAGGHWRIVSSSSRSLSSSSATIDPLPQYERGGYMNEFGPPPPSMGVHPYSQGPPHWQDMNFARQQQQHHQQPWDHSGSYNLMYERRVLSNLYPVQQQPMAYHEHLHPHPAQFQFQSHPQQQGFSGDAPMYYDAASAPPTRSTSMQNFQAYYGHPAGAGEYGYASPMSSTAASIAEYGQGSSFSTLAPSAAVTDVTQSMGDSEMEFSDAGYSPLQQPLQKDQSTRSPCSTASIYSRGSSLSSSLTLSPIVRAQTQAGQGAGSTVKSESGPKFDVGPQRPLEKDQVGSVHQSPTNCQANLEQPETSMATAIARDQAQQPLSVSFTHNARTSSSTYHASTSTATHLLVTTAAIPAASDIAASTPMNATTHVPDRVPPHDSVMELAPSAFSDHAPLPVNKGDQEQAQPFRRPTRQPHVPVMTFSSGTVLGTRAEHSPPGPLTPVALAHEPSASDFPVHQSGSDLFAEATATTSTTAPETVAKMAVSPSQRRDDDSTAEGHTKKTETALPAFHPLVAASPQPRRHFFSPSGFLFRDLDEHDELDRLLDLQSQHHEMDIMEEGPTQPSERPQMMSPGTLSALHHFSTSNEGSSPSKTHSQRSGGPLPGSYTPTTFARSIDLPASSSSSGHGSLGENEYLLHHQSRPPVSKIYVRRYGAAMGSAPASGLGLGGSSSDGYGNLAASSGGLDSGGIGLGTGAGTGTVREDRSLTDDLPWAIGRHEDTTSSEIACQLFSGLDASRGGGTGGEGRVWASGMGVGIGTAIGSRNGPDSGGAMYGRTRSVQTLQLSDQTEQYPFSEEQVYSRSVSPSEQQLHQQHVGGVHGETDYGGVDSPEDKFSIRADENGDQEDADKLEELGFYSQHSSARDSPVEAFDEDDYDDDEGMSYDQAQQSLDMATDQLRSQGNDGSNYGCEAGGDVEGMELEGGYGYSNRVGEGEARQRQLFDGDLLNSQELTSSVCSSQASTVSDELLPN
ncbi:hypothetical protein BGW39_003551 [Mortierella sp. 14UC]|nr:hypothetical protein BGW39_003551 [Mortierella sp. 14UC]